MQFQVTDFHPATDDPAAKLVKDSDEIDDTYGVNVQFEDSDDEVIDLTFYIKLKF